MKLFAQKIIQNNSKESFLTVIKFKDLRKIASVTFRESSESTNYQRKHNDSHVNNIARFLENKSEVIKFPTPIIIANNIDVLPEIDDINDDDNRITSIGTLDIKNKETYYELNINDAFNNESFYIVDGQHRFLGIQKYFKDNKDANDIDISVVILFDYSLKEQAEVFTNVNYNQKSMNKSLVYDIFGSFGINDEQYNFSHLIVKCLNSDPISPLKGIVKMLGVGNGIVSQAFIIETIIELTEKMKIGIFTSALGYFVQNKNIYDFNTIKKNNYEIKGRVGDLYYKLRDFFTFIKEISKESWPKEDIDKEGNKIYKSNNYDYILLKTTGIYALFMIFKDLESTKYSWEKEDIKNIFIKNEEVLFRKDSPFAQGSGKKMQKSLYNGISILLNAKKVTNR